MSRSRSIRSSWRQSSNAWRTGSARSRAMNESTHRCAVLIVDDDPDMQELLRVALAADGYDVTAVSNGRDALFHLRSTPETCMIVLDLTLPDMDGMQFRAAQRRDRSLAWIPVVVLSGAIDGPALAHELGAGA